MVVDNIRNGSMYFSFGTRFRSAFEFLMNTDFSITEPGTYEIDGTNIFALIQCYQTKPINECVWETHRLYYDVQYVLSGTEQMGYANIGDASAINEYDFRKDIQFYHAHGSMIVCNPGTFVVFGPQDVHMPCVSYNNVMNMRKIVVKIRI